MDLARYTALFLTESREHLAASTRLLLDWERDPRAREPMDGLFRGLHTIKGMAATMGYAEVTELAHGAEELLDAVRQARLVATPDVFQLLFRAVDSLALRIERAAGGDGAAQESDAGLAQELSRVVGATSAERVSGSSSDEAQGAPAALRPRGAALLLRVAIRPGAVMRGARAALILSRASEIGEVGSLQPPMTAMEREDFDGRFGFRLVTNASIDQVEELIRSAGEVASVAFDRPEAMPSQVRQRRQVRVDQVRLDTLMKRVGELVVARNRLLALAAASEDAALSDVATRIGRLASDLQTEVIAARMTPVSEVFERFPRLVRDLSRDLQKQIRLDMQGGEIELDRSVIDELGEPLLHLVRNACDHGIESPDVRAAAGKPAEGRVTLSAVRERNSVAIRVADDGRGIDRKAVAAAARSESNPDHETGTLSDAALLGLIARPGFSLARSVSEVSGRGVGVDAALTRVRALGGTLEVQSAAGEGATFLLRVPFTLAIVRALLAEAGGERYAVPLAYVSETVEYDPGRAMALRDREAVLVREELVPTLHLRELVERGTRTGSSRRPTMILEVGSRRRALVADALLGQQDIVIEPFDAPAGMPAYVGGATILADGLPALILDAPALL